MMIRLIFGNNFQSNMNTPPAPATNITAVYTQVIQSAMKVFMSGALGRANVTGGSIQEKVVFKSSLGQVITSTILFALLTMTLVAAQFREGQDEFTLVHVAAALDGSDVPKKCLEMRQLPCAGKGEMVRLVPSGNEGVGKIVRIQSETDDSISP